jgi:hypothetical protein
MKISALKEAVAQDEEGAVLPVEGKDGEPYTAADGTPCTITVVGSESKRMRAAVDRQTRRVLRNQRTKMDPDALRTNRIELAAAAVVAWHGFEDEAGTDVPCTPENVTEVLGAADHVLEQVEAGVRRHASFFAKSSAS